MASTKDEFIPVADADSDLDEEKGLDEQSNNTLTWKNWANLVAFILNVLVTYLSITGIFGKTNTELSGKYQTLITPAGWAFSIWGIIFISEGIFTVAQMFPQFRNLPAVLAFSPWWWSACIFQVAWSIVFAQEWIAAALGCMVGILISLLGVLWIGDEKGTIAQYWLVRAPFSLHCGWIIVASALNVNVLADSRMASQPALLALAIFSLATVITVASLATVSIPVPFPVPNPIIPLVAGWALLAISSELDDPKELKDESRFNYSAWPEMVLSGLRIAAMALSITSFLLSAVAMALRIFVSKEEEEEEPEDGTTSG